MPCKFLILVTILSLTKSIISSKQNNFCFSAYTECNIDYSYPCEKNLCAKNKEVCVSYKKSKKFFFLNLRHIIRFKQNIPICKIDLDDFCSNSDDCFEIKKLIYKGNIIKKVIDKVDCKCQYDFKNICNRNYCGKSSNSCELIEKINNLTKYNIKKCVNKRNYTVVQKMNHFLF